VPVTPAHPAAVLALRGTVLPMSALVLGSMVPDAPVFLTGMSGYGITHSWWGVVTVDLVLVVVGLFVWFALLRDALVDLAPAAVRDRLPARARLSGRQRILVPVAAVIGSATHLVWDAFTHAYGWGTSHVAWLRAEHAGLEGYRWLQYVSGVLGLSIVLAAAAVEVSRRERQRPARPWSSSLPRWAVPTSAVVAALIGGAVAVRHAPDGVHAQAFNGVVAAGVSGVVLLLLLAISWHVDRRRAVRRPLL